MATSRNGGGGNKIRMSRAMYTNDAISADVLKRGDRSYDMYNNDNNDDYDEYDTSRQFHHVRSLPGNFANTDHSNKDDFANEQLRYQDALYKEKRRQKREQELDHRPQPRLTSFNAAVLNSTRRFGYDYNNDDNEDDYTPQVTARTIHVKPLRVNSNDEHQQEKRIGKVSGGGGASSSQTTNRFGGTTYSHNNNGSLGEDDDDDERSVEDLNKSNSRKQREPIIKKSKPKFHQKDDYDDEEEYMNTSRRNTITKDMSTKQLTEEEIINRKPLVRRKSSRNPNGFHQSQSDARLPANIPYASDKIKKTQSSMNLQQKGATTVDWVIDDVNDDSDDDKKRYQKPLSKQRGTSFPSKSMRHNSDEEEEDEDDDVENIESSVTPMRNRGADLQQQQSSLELLTPHQRRYFDLITDDLLQFVLTSAPQGVTTKCCITRDKRGMGKGSRYPIYYMHFEKEDGKKVFLLAGRKRKKSASSNYVITVDPIDLSKDGDNIVAKLKASTLLGTHFTLYDCGDSPKKSSTKHDLREELVSVVYERNILGIKGPRKMSVLLPAMSQEDQDKRVEIKPIHEHETIMEKWKRRDNDIIELHNKTPVWNEETQSHVLNFHGRVTHASVKNFQIVHKEDLNYIVMQFGRYGTDVFNCDYSYPLCALQAFGIALSSFDSKLGCE